MSNVMISDQNSARPSCDLSAGCDDLYVFADAGAVIFQEGDSGDCAYLIERGSVEITVERDGRRIVVAQRGPGELFGEMAIIDSQPRSATVTALQPCELLIVGREQIAARLEQTDPILRMCMRVTLERMRTTLSQLQSNTVKTVEAPHIVSRRRADQGASRDEHAYKEIRLERELKRALHNGDFEVHYQPIIRLRDRRPIGFEALIRWRHAQRGLISPGVFIPTAEASGLIMPLGRWLLNHVCQRMSAFLAAAGTMDETPLFISINTSGRDFTDANFVPYLRQTLAETGVDPRTLKLEITESLLMQQPEIAASALTACKEMGLSIAIDDFGTGYSSLSYLNKFPIDTLKIDRSFVQGIDPSATHQADGNRMIGAIIGLAHNLGLPIVAEGIETMDQATILDGLNCQFGQGYYFDRPMLEEQARAILTDWRSRARLA